VPLGIARHAIEILTALAGTKIASRSRQSIRDDAILQANLGRAEALVRSGRAYVHEALGEAWEVVNAGQALTVAQRAALWLAGTHAANTAKEAVELMFSAGGSASPYTGNGLERCVRDIHAAAQHIILTAANYQMVGQAFLGADMRRELLLALDDRSGA
jgi:alkylation response protein AidB-like acyl-CoA dehydrogenase